MTAYQDRIPAPSATTANRRSEPPTPKKSAASLLTGQAIKNAIAYNNEHWRGEHRTQIFAMIRVEKGGEARFDENDIRAIARIQQAERLPIDGRLSARTMTAFFRGGLQLAEVRAKPEEIRLVFYPGEFEDLAAWRKAKEDAIAANGGKPLGDTEYRKVKAPPGHGMIYVEVRGNIVDAIQARGGPPFAMKDLAGHTADPSKAGSYKLGAGKSVVTKAWANSQIAWGAPIRELGGEFQFKNPGQDWQFATGPKARLPIPYPEFYEPDGSVSKIWRKNDFGETGFHLEGSPGLFVHTTPDTEETRKREHDERKVPSSLELDHSHGCLHVDPSDRNRWIKSGYLQKGVTLVIKRYDETLDPSARR